MLYPLRVQFQLSSVREPTYFTADTLLAYRVAIAQMLGISVDRVVIQLPSRRRRLLAGTTLAIYIGVDSMAQAVAAVDALTQPQLSSALQSAGLGSLTIVPGSLSVVDTGAPTTAPAAIQTTAPAPSTTTTTAAIIVVPPHTDLQGYAAPPAPPSLELALALAACALLWVLRLR